eukprot:1793265-Rhodomonas_salina.1
MCAHQFLEVASQCRIHFGAAGVDEVVVEPAFLVDVLEHVRCDRKLQHALAARLSRQYRSAQNNSTDKYLERVTPQPLALNVRAPCAPMPGTTMRFVSLFVAERPKNTARSQHHSP